jgi:hypothetical protein
MPTYYTADGLTWQHNGRDGDTLDDFEIARDQCDDASLAEYDKLDGAGQDRVDMDAAHLAWWEDRENSKPTRESA